MWKVTKLVTIAKKIHQYSPSARRVRNNQAQALERRTNTSINSWVANDEINTVDSLKKRPPDGVVQRRLNA
jgi:hypothetical protein